MLLNNSLVHEYIDRVLKDERVSLNDSMISNFVEVFYGKVIFLHEFSPKKHKFLPKKIILLNSAIM